MRASPQWRVIPLFLKAVFVPSTAQHRVIRLVETESALRADRGWFIGAGHSFEMGPQQFGYLLLNRSRPSAVAENGDPFTVKACFATVEIRWTTLDFTAPQRWAGDRWDKEAGWFDGPLTLAKMAARPQTWFSRELRVAPIRVSRTEVRARHAMKISWQIFGKDVRRLWLPLTLWGVLIMARQVAEWRTASVVTDDPGWIERMKIFSGLLSTFEKVVSYILAGMLVLEDPALGSTAFWLTRPVSGRRMFGAKLLGFIGLALWPLLLSLPAWIARGTGSGEVVWTSDGRVTGQAIVLMAGMLLAAFVESINQFFSWSLGLGLVLVGVVAGLSDGRETFFTQSAFGLRVSLFVTAIVATGVLYQLRRRKLALGVCLVGGIVATVIPTLWA